MSWKEMKQLTSFNLENPGIYLASCGHQSPIRIESGIPSAIADQGRKKAFERGASWASLYNFFGQIDSTPVFSWKS